MTNLQKNCTRLSASSPFLCGFSLVFLGRTLTPVLFLQMDNCYQESKNRYILGFCSPLVEKEIFQEASAKDNYKVTASAVIV